MIISNSRRFIFCHIHKTAGESITEGLQPHLGWNDVVLGGTAWGEALNPVFAQRFGLSKHSPASDIRDVVGADLWRDYFTFSVVRHPFHRARSLHQYLGKIAARENRGGLRQRLAYLRKDTARKPWSWPGMQAYVASRSFSAFIRDPNFLRDLGARSQKSRLSDPATGALLVDHVARFENLREEFARIAGRIGAPDAALPWMNPSRAVEGGGFSQEDRAYLADLYADDLEAFGYAVEDGG